MLINMGPQHPSTHGVLRLVLRTDGEVVGELTPNIGYLHRCAEKIGENLSPRQFLPYADRLDYLASMNMNLGWSLAVEKLLGFVPSERLRHLRVLVCELDRIASHLVAAGCYGLDLGSFTPFMWCFREREKILCLFEELCGARLTYSLHRARRRDLRPARGLAEELRDVPDRVRAGHRRVARDADEQFDFHPPHGEHRRAHARRWRSTTAAPVRSCGEAASTGTCAATARRSTRGCTKATSSRSSPRSTGKYPHDCPYPAVPPEAVLGDCWHRFYVRMLEVVQSMKLIRQAMEKYSQTSGSAGRADQAAAEAARRHGLPGDRGPQGPDGLHADQRRHARALAGADPQQQFLQSFGRLGIVPGMPDCRRAGGDRLVGYRVGRD